MPIIPIGDRVLVKIVVEEEVTASGIVLPDTVDKEKKAEGEIVALGNGEKLTKLGLKVGQKVLFEKWGGRDFWQHPHFSNYRAQSWHDLRLG